MRKAVLLLVVLVVLLIVSACGGGGAVAQIGVTLEQDCQNVRAEPASSPEHGKITFQVTNRGNSEVHFAVHKDGKDVAELKDLKAGQTKTLTATLGDGTYELGCEKGGRVVGRASFEVK